MNKPLDRYTFDLWAKGLDEKLDLLVQANVAQISINLSNERRMASLESENNTGLRRQTFLASMVSAIVGAVTGAYFGRVN